MVDSTPPWYMFPRCHTYGFDKPIVVLWGKKTSSIRIVTYVLSALQFAFLMLNRLMNAVDRDTSTWFTVTQMGRCWVRGDIV